MNGRAAHRVILLAAASDDRGRVWIQYVHRKSGGDFGAIQRTGPGPTLVRVSHPYHTLLAASGYLRATDRSQYEITPAGRAYLKGILT